MFSTFSHKIKNKFSFWSEMSVEWFNLQLFFNENAYPWQPGLIYLIQHLICNHDCTYILFLERSQKLWASRSISKSLLQVYNQ